MHRLLAFYYRSHADSHGRICLRKSSNRMTTGLKPATTTFSGYSCKGFTQPNPLVFFVLNRQYLNKLPTDCLQATLKKKAHYQIDSGLSSVYMGWLMGLEPTTTGITILDSTI